MYTAIKTDPQPGKEKQTWWKHAEIIHKNLKAKTAHQCQTNILQQYRRQNTKYCWVLFCASMNASVKLLKFAFLCGIPGKANRMTFNLKTLVSAFNLDFPSFLLLFFIVVTIFWWISAISDMLKCLMDDVTFCLRKMNFTILCLPESDCSSSGINNTASNCLRQQRSLHKVADVVFFFVIITRITTFAARTGWGFFLL